jgi:VWFA-related protein
MKKLFLGSLLVFGISLSGFAQNPPSNDDIVKITTNLIQIDVTVTDKSGKTVQGLTPGDFEVFENGEKQTITNFSFVSQMAAGATVGDAANPQNAQNPQAPAAAPLARSQVRRTIAIVLDDLNLSFGSVFYTRLALTKFVNEQMGPSDLVAIIRTGGGVGALQQFTSDKRTLLAAIEKLRWNPLGAAGVEPVLSTGQDAEDISERFTTESDHVAAGPGGDTSGRVAGRKRANLTTDKARDYNGTKNASETDEGIFAQVSLSTIRYIISGMNELPGRKALMLISDGMRIHSGSNKSGAGRTYDYLQDVIDFANRSAVTVYTFDARGMQTGNIQASDITYEIIDGHRQQKVAERVVDFKEKQDGLELFADRTGGKALLNSNNLNFGMERVLEEQNGYYLIAYQPDTDTFDAAKRRFNKLEVKVKRSGLKANYRSGFFSSPGSDTLAGGAGGAAVTSEQRMAKALTSPFAANEIALNINALYADDPVDGAFIRSFVHIDAKSLKFTTDAEGWKKATFDIAAVTFGDNGQAVEKKETKYTIKTKGPTYEAMLRNGFVYVLIMPVKLPGTYQYRVALRDEDTGKIGSASQILEIPDLAKNKLAVSSLAVEDVSMATWQNITQGKVGSAPGQMQVASTLLYDTVLKQFPSGTVLRYGFEVYNAKTDGSQKAQLETQTKILQNNKAIVEGNLTKVNTENQVDPKHVRISGNMMLKDTLPPGDYALLVTVKDTVSKQTTTQVFPFEIVK